MENINKTERVTVRLTPTEAEQLSELAKAEKTKPTTYAYGLIIKKISLKK